MAQGPASPAPTAILKVPALLKHHPVRLLAVGVSAGTVALVLTPTMSQQHEPPTSAWTPEDDEDEMQQALSDECAEAAPWLSHPSHDVLVTLAAGGISGAVAKTAVAPLARLTILYQVQALQPMGSQTPSLLAAMQQVARQEGLRSLWKGNLATILHRVPYAAVNFSVFENSKAQLQRYTNNDVLRRLVAGGLAGLVACTAAYPLDLVRTRLSAQRDMLPSVTRLTDRVAHTLGVTPDVSRPTVLDRHARSHLPAAQPNYRGILHAFRCILREDGLRGLYRGLGATLVQVTPTLALNFCLYDSFRDSWIRQLSSTTPPPAQQPQQQLEQSLTREPAYQQARHPQQGSEEGVAGGGGGSGRVTAAEGAVRQQISLAGSLLCASAAGLVTSTATFPLDVIRKRLQTDRSLRGQGSYASMCARIWSQHGARGFYAGIIPEYCKVLPGMAIAFGTFEGIRSAFGIQHGQ